MKKNIGTIYNKIANNLHIMHFKQFIVGGIVAIFMNYVGNYLINKNLSKEELGQFSYYFNIMTLLTSIVSLNVFQAYLRFNNVKYNTKNLRIMILKISLISTILLFIVSSIIIESYFVSIFAFFILFNERVYYFRSMIQINRMNVLKYLFAILLAIFLIIFLLANQFNYKTAILSYGLSYIIVFIVGYIVDSNVKQQSLENEGIDISYIDLFKFTIPVTFTMFITWIAYVSDQYLIKMYLSLNELGNYAMGYRIIAIIKLFTSLFLLYYPMLYFEEATKKNIFLIRRIRWIFVIILFVLTLLLILLRKYVYIFLGASNYQEYTGIFILLSLSEFFRISADLFLMFRTFTLQNWYGTFCISIVAALTFILNIIFLKKHGIYFAAFAQLGASLIYLCTVYFLSIIPERKYFAVNI